MIHILLFTNNVCEVIVIPFNYFSLFQLYYSLNIYLLDLYIYLTYLFKNLSVWTLEYYYHVVDLINYPYNNHIGHHSFLFSRSAILVDSMKI